MTVVIEYLAVIISVTAAAAATVLHAQQVRGYRARTSMTNHMRAAGSRKSVVLPLVFPGFRDIYEVIASASGTFCPLMLATRPSRLPAWVVD